MLSLPGFLRPKRSDCGHRIDVLPRVGGSHPRFLRWCRCCRMRSCARPRSSPGTRRCLQSAIEAQLHHAAQPRPMPADELIESLSVASTGAFQKASRGGGVVVHIASPSDTNSEGSGIRDKWPKEPKKCVTGCKFNAPKDVGAPNRSFFHAGFLTVLKKHRI